MTARIRNSTGMGAVPPAAAIRILVVEAHRLFAEALRAKLASDSRLDVVGVAHDGSQGVALARELSPDVVVLDVDLPLEDSIETTRLICEADPSIRLLALLDSGPDANAESALAHQGAAGFIRKDRSAVELAEMIPEIASMVLAFNPTISLVAH
jgi:DNA-binding NarL/FixJ family response regulator